MTGGDLLLVVVQAMALALEGWTLPVFTEVSAFRASPELLAVEFRFEGGGSRVMFTAVQMRQAVDPGQMVYDTLVDALDEIRRQPAKADA